MHDEQETYINEGQDTGLWPTSCSYGCMVEIDSKCEHGYKASYPHSFGNKAESIP